MEITLNLISGFGLKYSGFGSESTSYQSICSQIQKKLNMLEQFKIKVHLSY